MRDDGLPIYFYVGYLLWELLFCTLLKLRAPRKLILGALFVLQINGRLQNHGLLGEMVEKSFCQDLCNVFIDNLAYNQLKKYYRANIEEINGKK
ncbi:hypothetical protein IBBPl23_27 [Paenibacillus phage phiIBB_P123]|uniref:Uncharacterized protein n=1 Tax=Paenibacillus phage phiIBB_P123 TaxID=1337877 RepID=R9W003_9CAUD|nr:hypothetical protein IBBPl23_27 [Paenibacillus phage phiIBB_P123]AGN89342.2 hypothetical protein IBBPl23_27 [Paenibacillus phage phiIBB_P123]